MDLSSNEKWIKCLVKCYHKHFCKIIAETIKAVTVLPSARKCRSKAAPLVESILSCQTQSDHSKKLNRILFGVNIEVFNTGRKCLCFVLFKITELPIIIIIFTTV